MLNGHPEVKAETVARVRQAMVALGFVPSPLGRALRGSRTGIVGVCFQAIGSPIVARKIATLQRVLRGAGFRALFEVTDGHPALELEVIRHFTAMRIDGLVLVGGITEANAERVVALLREPRLRAVVVDPVQKFPLPTVELNRAAGMRLALGHLLALGHHRFALLGIDERVLYGRNRWEGIRAVAAERGLDVARTFVSLSENDPGALDFAYGRRLAENYLRLAARPTAILALNDQVAIGAMAFLQQAGIAIPRDVSVVGFDNLDVAAHVNPRLTTIDQHNEQLMSAAVDLLSLQSTRDLRPDELYRAIEPVFVSGASTGPVAGTR